MWNKQCIESRDSDFFGNDRIRASADSNYRFQVNKTALAFRLVFFSDICECSKCQIFANFRKNAFGCIRFFSLSSIFPEENTHLKRQTTNGTKNEKTSPKNPFRIIYTKIYVFYVPQTVGELIIVHNKRFVFFIIFYCQLPPSAFGLRNDHILFHTPWIRMCGHAYTEKKSDVLNVRHYIWCCVSVCCWAVHCYL